MASQQFEEEDYTKELNLAMWRRIFGLALRHKRFIYPLVAISIIVGIAEASFTMVTRQVIDSISSEGKAASLWPFAASYTALLITLSVGIWVFIILAGRISSDMSHAIRRDAFQKLQELSFSYFDRRPVGWLMARLTSDCSKLADMIGWGMLDLIWCVTVTAIISGLMFYMHWKLTLVVLSVVPVLFLVSMWFKRAILRISRQVKKLNSQITAAYNEGLTGVRTTKSMVREKENLHEFSGLASEMAQASIRNAFRSALFMPAVLTLGSIGTSLGLWRGGLWFANGGLSIGTLIAFLSYTRWLFEPITQMANIITNLQGAQASGERLLSLLDEVPEIKDSPEVLAILEKRGAPWNGQSGPHFQQQLENPPLDGVERDGFHARIEQIEFREVCFGYKDGARVLENFNFVARAGQTIALVGPTGGGKTTIVSLLCRFYEPDSGQILINGTDYRQCGLHWLQSNLGMVLQTPHLFNDTIMENIRYGRLNATDAEVMAAAKIVNAHEFITELEKSYQTLAGEGGEKLSVGQKQLVSFTRAVLANPQLFVMDEATSSVDTETEQLIQKGLARMLKGRICFVIAHRLSTIRSADRILVIERGKITESGKHHELIRQGGHYYQLYTRQFTNEKEAELLGALAIED